MLIDWFTVGAQFINFLVLVALLKVLFYRPILDAIAAREARNAKALQDAAESNVRAEAQMALVLSEQAAIEKQRAELLQKAAEDAEKSRLDLIASAQNEVAAMRRRWMEALQREKEQAEHSVAVAVHAELLSLVRRVLTDLADAQLEQSIITRFIHSLDALSKADIGKLESESKSPVIVRSSFQIPPARQNELSNAIHQRLSGGAVQFETAPNLICGIEVATAGHKVSWNVDDWLHSFERGLGELLENGVNSHAKTTDISR